MRPKKPIMMGKATIINTNTEAKKKIELQIAKKQYEIKLLEIELKYPKNPKKGRKI
jgi:hypothetical protein